jgi:hypothetical protein
VSIAALASYVPRARSSAGRSSADRGQRVRRWLTAPVPVLRRLEQ